MKIVKLSGEVFSEKRSEKFLRYLLEDGVENFLEFTSRYKRDCIDYRLEKSVELLSLEEATDIYKRGGKNDFSQAAYLAIRDNAECAFLVYDRSEWVAAIKASGLRVYKDTSMYWGFNGAEPTVTSYRLHPVKASRPPRGQYGRYQYTSEEVTPDEIRGASSSSNIYHYGIPEPPRKLVVKGKKYGDRQAMIDSGLVILNCAIIGLHDEHKNEAWLKE